MSGGRESGDGQHDAYHTEPPRSERDDRDRETGDAHRELD